MNLIPNRVGAAAAGVDKEALRRRSSAANPGLGVYSSVRNRSLLKLETGFWSEMLVVHVEPETPEG